MEDDLSLKNTATIKSELIIYRLFLLTYQRTMKNVCDAFIALIRPTFISVKDNPILIENLMRLRIRANFHAKTIP